MEENERNKEAVRLRNLCKGLSEYAKLYADTSIPESFDTISCQLEIVHIVNGILVLYTE